MYQHLLLPRDGVKGVGKLKIQDRERKKRDPEVAKESKMKRRKRYNKRL
jgi:hypothetical protein